MEEREGREGEERRRREFGGARERWGREHRRLRRRAESSVPERGRRREEEGGRFIHWIWHATSGSTVTHESVSCGSFPTQPGHEFQFSNLEYIYVCVYIGGLP